MTRVSSRRRRLSRWGVSLLVLSLVAAGSWWASSRVESPSQAAANAKPPTPTVLTGRVELRRITDSLVVNGMVTQPTVQVAISPPVVPDGIDVVTEPLPKVGASLRVGQLLLAISGQPIFVLQGSVPAYRDLRLGDAGPDVRQLQGALVQAGYPAVVTGTVDGPTVRAVGRLFASHGYAQTGSANLGAAAVASQSGANTGFILRRTAIEYVHSLPATVTSSQGAVGDPAETIKLAVASGPLQVTLDVDADQIPNVRQGMSVRADVSGRSATGVVSAVHVPQPTVTGNSASIDSGHCDVRLDDPRLSLSAQEPVVGTILLHSSAQPQLSVPVAAVHRTQDGHEYIRLLMPDKSIAGQSVPVVAGASGDGYVAVTAAHAELHPGQEVALVW